jgi:hypothetical protein
LGAYVLVVLEASTGRRTMVLFEPAEQVDAQQKPPFAADGDANERRRSSVLWEEGTAGSGFRGIAAFVPDIFVGSCPGCDQGYVPSLDQRRVAEVLEAASLEDRIAGIGSWLFA